MCFVLSAKNEGEVCKTCVSCCVFSQTEIEERTKLKRKKTEKDKEKERTIKKIRKKPKKRKKKRGRNNSRVFKRKF